MSANIIGLIGIAALIILLFSRMWIGAAMALVGFLGYAWIDGFDSALGVLAAVPYGTLADYVITVLPLFILMGNVVSETGICGDLYKTGHKWFGSMPGGLAMGTVGAGAMFAAICGTSMASAITLGRIALPEMKKYGYDDRLATGAIASGASLGVLIPPSLGFILYAILTEESVGMLFIAGIIPGILLAGTFIITVYVIAKRNPEMGPPGEKTSFIEKILSLRFTWAMVILFLFVMGGIYMGVFTPNEAGALGSFGAIVITFISKRLDWKKVSESFLQAGQMTAMIVVLLTGAMIFMRFLAISQLPFTVSEFVSGLVLPRHLIFVLILIFYIICGMFLDVIAAVVLTIPIIFPTMMALGFDPIWFGVVVVMIMEIGMITPPIGMNVFLLSGVTKVPLGIIFRGIIPFTIAYMIFIVILTIFPQLATFLPYKMG